MTQKVNPSFKRHADSFKTAGAIALAGGSSDGWISPSGEPSSVAIEDADIDETALDAFAETSSGSSLDVTIAPGEAFVYGSWLAKDTNTTVTLSSSTSDQTVYVGWEEGVSNSVIIGTESAFSTTDERVAAYDFTTDGSGVTSVTDRRELGQFQSLSHAKIAKELGLPTYSDSSNAPQKEGYAIYIDGSGSESTGIFVHNGNEYQEGGNTDEEIEDLVDSLLSAGTNISLTYDDSASTLTIDTSALDEEEVEDVVNGLVSDGNAISTVYDDPSGTLTISVVENDITLGNLSGDTDGISEGTSNLYFTDERAQDATGSLIVGGDKISSTYDDSANTLTIDTSALDEEEVEDATNALLSGGNAITTTYDDAGDTLTVDVSESDISLSNLSGDTDNIAEGTNNLYFTDERVDDAVNDLLIDGNGIFTSYDDGADTLTIGVDEADISLSNLTGDTDDISEGTTNLYFTDERAQDAVGTIVGSLLNYDDSVPSLTIDIGDDQELLFGSNDDMSVRYDSANDEYRWQDNTNTSDKMALDRTTGNLNITGEITENTSL